MENITTEIEKELPLSQKESTKNFTLQPEDNNRLGILCGECDDNLHFLERNLGVEINNRGMDFQIIGIPHSVDTACKVLKTLYQETEHSYNITTQHIMLTIKAINTSSNEKD